MINKVTGNEKLFDNLLTKEEIAEELGLSPATVAKWMSQRKMPCIKIGRRNYGLRASISRWIEEQKKPARR